MNWKRSAICCVSFIAVFFGEIAVNIACGPEQDPYDYYVSYFHNNVQGDDYVPFSFNSMVPLYSYEEVASEAELNSAEWASYLKVKKEDVFKVMYQTDSATSVKLNAFEGHTIDELPDSLQNNSFLMALTKNKKAMDYYAYAKSCEPFATVNFDRWNPVVRDSSIIAKKAEEGLALLGKGSKNDFLKLRYAYQAERLFFFAGNYPESKNTYEKFIAPLKTNSAAKGWALAVYAGGVRYTGNPAEAAFLYSKVFASNPERRVQAYRNFYYTSANAGEVLKYAKTNEEKANVLAIKGFGNPDPDLATLQQVYQYDASSLLNGALLVREVNKLEQNLIQKSEYGRDFYDSYALQYSNYYRLNTDSIRAVNLKHLTLVKNFALKLANQKKYPQPELGTVTAAYLSWMEDKPLQALLYLTEIKPDAKLTAKLKDQIRIVQLLCEAAKIKKGMAFNENNLLPVLKWLDEKRFEENKKQSQQGYYDYDWSNGANHFTITTRNVYQQLLVPAYMKLGDTAKAALAMLKGDIKFKTLTGNSFAQNMSYQTATFWQNRLGPKTMQALAALRAKPQAAGFERFLTNGLFQLSNDDFNELFGTAYLRTHDYAKALACFKKLSPKYKLFAPDDWYSDKADAKLQTNPFVTSLTDYPKKYGQAGMGLNKKTFAQEMLRLQKLAIGDKKNAAQHYFKMANAVYQTGYYGNSWFLISYDWSSNSNYNKAVYSYDADFKLAKTAKAWYAKARSLSTDANFKARCTFMLAKCEQKKIINNSYNDIRWYEQDYEARNRSFLAKNFNNPYFKELKTSYAKTPFYKIAVNECSYLREFLRSSAGR